MAHKVCDDRTTPRVQAHGSAVDYATGWLNTLCAPGTSEKADVGGVRVDCTRGALEKVKVSILLACNGCLKRRRVVNNGEAFCASCLHICMSTRDRRALDGIESLTYEVDDDHGPI